jgi:SET domain-containing protein
VTHRSHQAASPVEVRDSGIQGRGVYAACPIARGTWIIEYTGERISHDEADRRYDDATMQRHHTFLFIVDREICIDAAASGNEARFINHACEPNCETVLTVDEKEVWIVALRDIAAGEELTYDYGYVLDGESVEEALRTYPCHCGSGKCRGTILRLT